MEVESLVGKVLLDVESPVADEAVVPEPPGGLVQERRRHVGEHILSAVGRQPGEHVAGGAAGACTDLQYSQRTTRGYAAGDPGDHRSRHLVVDTEHDTVVVDVAEH